MACGISSCKGGIFCNGSVGEIQSSGDTGLGIFGNAIVCSGNIDGRTSSPFLSMPCSLHKESCLEYDQLAKQTGGSVVIGKEANKAFRSKLSGNGGCHKK